MESYKAHVLFFPFPAQGHINPAFQFAKRLASKGLKTTLATTIYLAKSIHVKASKVQIETISDGYDETGFYGATSEEEYFKCFREVCSQTLADLIKKYENTSNPVTCLVHDSICPWASDVAKELGLVVARFFTQSCSVSYIFYHVKIGTLTVPVEEPVDSIPGLPTLDVHDLPTTVTKLGFSSSTLNLLAGQFTNPDKPDWLLFNSFDHLESQEMEGETKAYTGHVLFFPFPVKVTQNYLSYIHVKASKVEVETISNGYDETSRSGAKKSSEEFFELFREVCSRSLTDLIKKCENTSNPVICLVHDAFVDGALDVVKELGLVVATFFTRVCSPSEVAKLKFPSSSLDLLVGQFNHPDKADWPLLNSFDTLESQVLKLYGERWPGIRTIGPTTPSMYLDKRVESDTENSLNVYKTSDGAYFKWLNTKEAQTVVYISFGSLAECEGEQMEELMWGIKQSEKYFLWVVRETEQSKLPSSFAEETSDKGLVVSWCSQMEVLAHEAVGCFVTHCGWNSTMEALSLGVPMVAMPNIWDQMTNAKFVEDVWEVGVRVKADSKGIVRREEVESRIREVMESERGEMMKMNAKRWRALAKDAVVAGGSSDVNIDEFVASLSSN